MEKVVYIVGAGFSAPLGLPVMGNFLFKSKDLYFSNKEKYSHFLKVFDTIQKLSVTKNYYRNDLFNIEEILSILEMNEFLEGNQLADGFTKYIQDVINYFTPSLAPIGEGRAGNWYDWLFGTNNNDQALVNYAYFISALLCIEYKMEKNPKPISNLSNQIFTANPIKSSKARYTVLSLNYDMVLERFAGMINEGYQTNEEIAFDTTNFSNESDVCYLGKLHGCAENGSIVPPTWAKGTHSSIIPIWKNAFRALQTANHIRFIGYSMPVADSYIKYLLKSAVIESEHLKSIDVICLDNDNSVKNRFDEHISFTNYRFKPASVLDYFACLSDTIKKRNTMNHKTISVNTAFLEESHEHFMAN